jgi:multiple sugar transport system ATP-binding protein
MCRIQIRNLNKQFGDVSILKEINLTIDPGEFCVFIGPSGCGKSTLLRIVAGLEDPSSGEVEIDGTVVNNIAPSKRNVAMVFQSYALYPHMTAFENMAFGLRHQKLPEDEIQQRVADAARILHLEPLLERRPRELSGGQRQRVAIGRAIVRKPKVFLFDEPLSNLDAALRVATRVEIARLHRKLGSASMIYVTHDQVEAMTLADKIVLLRPGIDSNGAPSIAQVGHPLDLYHNPANQFVAGFIGSPSMNFLTGTVAKVASGRVDASVAGATFSAAVNARGLAADEPITLGIRPEHVQVGEGKQMAKVMHVECLGEHSYVYLALPNGGPSLLAKTQRDDLEVGDKLLYSLPATAMHVFRADGSALPRLAVQAAVASVTQN